MLATTYLTRGNDADVLGESQALFLLQRYQWRCSAQNSDNRLTTDLSSPNPSGVLDNHERFAHSVVQQLDHLFAIKSAAPAKYAS